MKNKNLPFVFFGTPNFAVVVLDELARHGFVPELIVSSPDKPQGRKMLLTKTPTKLWAEDRNIAVYQPEKLDVEAVENLQEFSDALFVVAAYGKLIPKSILDIPKCGTINVHPSLLPKLRGASPLQSALLLENKTGVTIMEVDEQMDHGAILAQEKNISWQDDITTMPKESVLEKLLGEFGGAMLARVMPLYVEGKISPTPQDDTQATATMKIKKEDGLLNFNDSPETNFRKIQAYDQWPRAYYFQKVDDKNLRIIVLDATIKNGELTLLRVLPEGGKEMSFEEFERRLK